MKKYSIYFQAARLSLLCVIGTCTIALAQGNKPPQPASTAKSSQVDPSTLKVIQAEQNRSQITGIAPQSQNPNGQVLTRTMGAITLPNDPMQTKMYKLKNGLSVWITVNKNEPRIQTMIAVKAGSKNDPATHTGLAHYLEHMLFKGTDMYGTKDYVTEKKYLDQIEALYEKYGAEKEEAKRKAIYHQIDSVSGIAAKYAIANEYDKMVSNLGAKGTNAFTSTDMTVYINDIPANQLEKWLTLESERFRNPVLRLFHTELEAVYEEKNRTLDNDSRKVDEALMASLFKNHSYGTQTTIGTIEHLKAPSITEIKKYFNANYVPNNMAIILSGDVNPEEALQKINLLFGGMQAKPVEPYTFKPEVVRSEPEVKTIYGPDKEEVTIGFRMPGCQSPDYATQQMVDYLLNNGTAGLINLNLLKTQKVLNAGGGIDENSDYNIFELGANPREGQTLEECRDLLMGQLEALKKGDFDESMLPAIIANMKVEELKRLESNQGRAFTLEGLFVHNIPYNSYLNRFNDMKKLTKQDIMNFANKYFTNDYAIVFKKSGEDKTTKKVEKPAITPVEIDRVAQSPFLKKINEMKVQSVLPEFVNYDQAITKTKMKNGNAMWYVKNNDNQLFNLYYVFDMGSLNDKKLNPAISYLEFLGTDKYSSEQISKEFYKLACNFSVNAGDDQVYVSLSGLQENFAPAVELFESLLNNCNPNDEALHKMVEGMIKDRSDALKNKNQIRSRMVQYAIYGAQSPATYVLTNAELNALTGSELTDKIKSLKNFEHRIYYVGPENIENIQSQLEQLHKVAATPQAVPPAFKPVRNKMTENKVLFVDYQQMVQAEIMWVNRQGDWDVNKVPTVRLFNEYFGGSMSGVVFQTIRESKALAYSCNANYATPSKKEDPFYINAYVGTQADKLDQAVPAMNELFTNMPYSEKAFEDAKQALKNKIESERIRRTALLFGYQNALKLGLQNDIRENVYSSLDRLQYDDIKNFEQNSIKNVPFTYCVLASGKKVNTTDLAKYGKVTELKVEELFGY